MNFAGLNKLNQTPAISANIISDGCRDYVVSIEKAKGSDLIRTWRGQIRRFASLAEAKQAARRTKVDNIKLSVRVAADEACAGTPLQDSGFASVTLATTKH